MANVELEGVSKRFADSNQAAVDNVHLKIHDREFLVLVGPSGCGKSTTLRLIAGLEQCDEGIIRIGGREVNRVAPKDRDIAMVFQNYALYPHMTVYKNLSFGLQLRYGGGFFSRVVSRVLKPRRAAELSAKRREIHDRVAMTAERLGIEKLLKRKPHQLSGGERQRVALGRAIVRNPAAFLFDEPLSNLDAKLRGQLRNEIKRLHQQLDTTMIYVTHDQIEAMTLGDRIAVMKDGRMQQIGKPLDVYHHPENLFVAKFIGSIPMNLLTGTITTENQQLKLKTKHNEIYLENNENLTHNQPVVMGIRPENITILPANEEHQRNTNLGIIETVDQLGDSTVVHVKLKQHTENSDEQFDNLVVRTSSEFESKPGQRVLIEFDLDKTHWFDPKTENNLKRK